MSSATVAIPATQSLPIHQQLAWKLWVYTNYDCNLLCKYCVAKSGPNVPRRALPRQVIEQLADEAVDLGFDHLFLTGGEPFLLNDIYEIMASCSAKLPTTVLTNATLLHHKRLEQLEAVMNDQLILQVSLDGATPETHDRYRGRGTWARTVEGITQLLERGYRVRIGTTETPANTGHLDELRTYLGDLGIRPEDHFVRPLAKRGFSKEGLELNLNNLVPELTVNVDGAFWHPLSTEPDMQVARSPLPLRVAMDAVQALLNDPDRASSPRCKFT